MKKTIQKLTLWLLIATLATALLPVSVFAANGDSDEDIVYNVRAVVDGNYVVSAEKYNSYESEHFQILWGDKNNSAITEKWLAGNCKILEACWDVYMNDLGMTPPSLCTRKSGDHETHYKVNVVIMGTGIAGYESGWAYGGIDSQGYAYLMCDQAAMVYMPETWVTPHEFGHVTQFAQGYNSWENGTYLGSWYEAVGNWFREQYLYSEYYTSGQYYSTDFSYLYLRSISLTSTNGRAYYEAWPLFQYLTENPDNLSGYGADFMSRLLTNGDPNETVFVLIDRLADADLSDTLGYFAAHMATLDLERQEYYMKKMNEQVNYGYFFWQQFYTTLEEVIGEENVYTVPSERAPQQAAYVITPLNITGDEISVTLRGLTSVEGADWRACIVRVIDGEEVYSELFSNGETMTVSAKDVEEAYLTVAATPELSTYKKYDAFTQENELSYSKKNRYPYEVTMTGAEPAIREIESTSSGSAHPNGGGFVAKTAKVDDSVYVGPNAKVLGNAKVTGNVIIDDYAVVMGSAQIKGNAIIDGTAVVAGSAKVTGNAHVGDNAIVNENASVSDNAQVIESAYVYGNYKVKDNAIVKGLSLCCAAGTLKGQAIADGDLYEDSSSTASSGNICGYLTMSNSSYVKSLKSTEGMHIGYRFNIDNEYVANERYGSTYALVRGAEWAAIDGSGEGVYTFDGKNQYMIMDGSTINSRDLQIVMNVVWKGGDADQRVFSYSGEGGEMYFTPKNANGKAAFVLGDAVVELPAMTEGEWAEVIITVSEGKIALTIGENTVVAETELLPVTLCSGNGFIGRNESGNYFNGSLDMIEYYFTNAAGIDLTKSTYVEPEPVVDDVTEPVDTSAQDTDPVTEKSGCGSSVGAVAIVVTLVSVLGCAVTKKD